MKVHAMSRRPATLALVGVALLIGALLPASASAVQDPGSCGAQKGSAYTTPLPAGMRTPGTHAVQWKSEYIDALTGDPQVDDSIVNEITIDAAAPAFRNTVLVRLFRNTTIVDGEVLDVDAIRPTQDARLYVNVSWAKDDQFFVGVFHLFARYETSPGTWSAYQELPGSPAQSFCTEFTKAIWHKGYGWG